MWTTVLKGVCECVDVCQGVFVSVCHCVCVCVCVCVNVKDFLTATHVPSAQID